MHPVIEALDATEKAAMGDSNDAEIEALQDARDTLVQYLPEPLRSAVKGHQDVDAEPDQAGYAASLDAESVRAEIRESGTYDPTDVQYVENLPDVTIGDAIRETVDDPFWEQFDRARGDTISRLLADRKYEATR